MGVVRWLLRRSAPFGLGLVVGTAGGVILTQALVGRSMHWMGAVGWSHLRAQVMGAQVSEAETDAAKEALVGHLEYLERVEGSWEEWKPGDHPLLGPRELAAERAMTAGRLARLEGDSSLLETQNPRDNATGGPRS
jgi:hypothetical protein